MTTSVQKQSEMNYALQLSAVLGKNWSIAFPPDESEWPDLMISDGSERFGLEVREITKDAETKKGSKGKAGEGRNSRRVQELIESYYAVSSVPLSVGVLGEFDDSAMIVEALVGFAESSEVWEQGRLDLDYDLKVYATRLPSTVGRYENWKNASDRVGWVREVEWDYIRPFVAEKEARIGKYKTHLKDVRLLLVADRTYSSGMLEFPENGFKIETAFDEVYLLEYPNKVHLVGGGHRR